MMGFDGDLVEYVASMDLNGFNIRTFILLFFFRVVFFWILS